MRYIKYDEADCFLEFWEDNKQIGCFGTTAEYKENYAGLIADWTAGRLSWNQLGVEIKYICEG